MPILNVTFQKNISTIDYILGDKNVLQAKQDQLQDIIKKKELENMEYQKLKSIKVRSEVMSQMFQKNVSSKNNMDDIFGYTSTILFIFFMCMHIFLSSAQYDIQSMFQFNKSVTYNIFPHIDYDAHLAHKQFSTKKEVKDYLLHELGPTF